ncbi:MAG TPA: hypothetical protein VKT52_04235 [Ktedonobacterales bacterium]|nr:hypothetical protein [Ktedonobacterales bacterium]
MEPTRSELAGQIVAEGSPSPSLAEAIRRGYRLLVAVMEAHTGGRPQMEPSKDVMELLDGLDAYMKEEGFQLWEQQPNSGIWEPSDVALSELYQDWIEARNRAREEAAREAAGNG